jgi:hypothetical protein
MGSIECVVTGHAQINVVFGIPIITRHISPVIHAILYRTTMGAPEGFPTLLSYLFVCSNIFNLGKLVIARLLLRRITITHH